MELNLNSTGGQRRERLDYGKKIVTLHVNFREFVCLEHCRAMRRRWRTFFPTQASRGQQGPVELIIAFFDVQYESHLRLQHEREFEELFYTGTRQGDETFASFILRWEAEMSRYGAYAHGTLPTHIHYEQAIYETMDRSEFQRCRLWVCQTSDGRRA
eukprot:2664499-Amphidinium_carterae.2